MVKNNIALFISSCVLCVACASCIYEAPQWSPDGKKIVCGVWFQDEKDEEQYQFFRVDPATGRSEQLTQFVHDKSGVFPSLSPDGTKLAFHYREEDLMPEDRMELRVMDLASGQTRKVLEQTKEEDKFYYTFSPWSPDGGRLCVQNFNPERARYELIVKDLEGGQKIVSAENSLRLPSWSPDGSRLACVLEKEGRYDIMLYHVSDFSQHTARSNIALPALHTKDLINFLAPAWSPDGKKIAFVEGKQISILTLATDDVRVLTRGKGFKIWPRWSPDGAKILFMKVRFKKKEPLYGDSLSELLIMDEQGKDARKLTNLRGEAYLPQWSPDGTRIAFLFAWGDLVSFLPGIVDLEGKVQFLPVNGHQRIGLALYCLERRKGEFDRAFAEKLLNGVVEEWPESKWAQEAKKILDGLSEADAAERPEEDSPLTPALSHKGRRGLVSG